MVLRLLRYYGDLWDKGLMLISEAERATKASIDGTCSQAWRLVYPLIKNHLTSFHQTVGVSQMRACIVIV